MPQGRQKNIIENIRICLNCNKEFTPRKKSSDVKTCSKKCGYKIRIVKPNSGQFKKGYSNRKGIKLSEEIKNNMRLARMKSKFRTGKLHPRYKYGSESYYRNEARRLIQSSNIKKECYICKTKERIHVHHKDRNKKNNVIENLIYICQSCHLKLHHREDIKKSICMACKKEFEHGRKSRKCCSQKCYKIIRHLTNQ